MLFAGLDNIRESSSRSRRHKKSVRYDDPKPRGRRRAQLNETATENRSRQKPNGRVLRRTRVRSGE